MTDQEKAADLRNQLTKLLAPVCDLLNAAKGDGYTVNFSVVVDAGNKSVIGPITVAKNL